MRVLKEVAEGVVLGLAAVGTYAIVKSVVEVVKTRKVLKQIESDEEFNEIIKKFGKGEEVEV